MNTDIKTKKSTAPILLFEQVSLASKTPGIQGLTDFSLRLEAASLAVIKLESDAGPLPLPDLAQGLRKPESGTIRFDGNDWSALSPEAQDKLRGRIGRVFHQTGFVSNLSVAANVTLSQLHHTRRPAADILAEAETLSRAAGLEALPQTRPAWCPRPDLRRAEWVRAFMGKPALILLEQPEKDALKKHLPLLVAMMQNALAHGAAMLLITTVDLPWPAGACPERTTHFTIQSEKLIPA